VDPRGWFYRCARKYLSETMILQYFLLPVLSGILLTLSFPDFDLEWLAWIALIPLLWSLRDTTPSRAAFSGFMTGFTFFLGTLYWIFNVLTAYGHLPSSVSIFILVLLIAYLALFFSAFAFLIRWVHEKSELPVILFAPLLWVALEYLRGFLLSGFPWVLLGYSQYRNLAIVQIADVTGVYGVSFILVLVNAALYEAAKGWLNRSWKQNARQLIAAGLVVGLAALYGSFRISQDNLEEGTGIPLQVALIQGNIRQDIKWEPQFQEETVGIYARLTRKAKECAPDLVVWPETATPFFFQIGGVLQDRVLELTREMDTPLLLGSPAFQRQGTRIDYHNSAFFLSPEKGIGGRYDKIHLVPFGEYAPLAGILGFTRDIIGAIGDFSPGEAFKLFTLPQGKFGVLICYEAIFPDLTRQFVKEGAQFLVNITNDAWFGRTSAPHQHLAMVTLRAVENSVPIVRAANTGISAIILSTGQVVRSSDLFTREWLCGKIFLHRSQTFYAQYGDLFAYLCMGISGLILMRRFLKRGRRVERNTR
jgi:apolipoprotein N-acyltransferase